MADVPFQLQRLDGFIREILAICKSPALSIGVLHNGEIRTLHYGARELERNQAPNDDTIYRLASLTKVLTASAVALLVDEGKLDWDTPIREYLPAFAARKDELGLKASLRDLLANRTGLALADFNWGQMYGEFLLPKDEIVSTAVTVPAVKPFRKRFVYSGWNYALVTEVVEAVTGKTLSQFIDERFSRPLGMQRTTLADTEDRDNVALGYAISSEDDSRHRIEFAEMNDGVGLAGAYAGKSSIMDLMIMYKELLKARQDQTESGLPRTKGSPFVSTENIFEPHIKVFGPTSYCLGLYKTTLPGILGIASVNTVAYLGLQQSPTMSSIQMDSEIEVWHHTGNIPGFLASTFLVPKLQTAVVALTNSVGYLDATDFVTQQILSVLLGTNLDKDLIRLAHAAKASNLKFYPSIQSKLLKGKGKTSKPSRPAEDYRGYYWNSAGTLCFSVLPQPGGSLLMKVQNVPLTSYTLQPYDGDTWWWPPDREDELVRKEMWTRMNPGVHLVSFSSSAGAGGLIDQFSWEHDFTAPAETFRRREEKPRWNGYSRLKARM